MINIKINSKYINEYKNIIQTTNIQLGYKELTNSIKHVKTCLEKEMVSFDFSKNIIESNIEFTYFHFSNDILKSKGLKLVLVFLHKEFKYEICLSGINRKKQMEFYNSIKDNTVKYTLSNDPSKTYYVLKHKINKDFDYENIDILSKELCDIIQEFTRYVLYELIK